MMDPPGRWNDLFYDDRIMSLVWALFILEPEICQQYFNVDEFDEQNKPLKISDNGLGISKNEQQTKVL